MLQYYFLMQNCKLKILLIGHSKCYKFTSNNREKNSELVAMVDSFEFLLLGNSYCLVKLYDAAQSTFQQNLCFVKRFGLSLTKRKIKLNFFVFIILNILSVV